ncbi:hypothetical protein HRE53_06320 [Acaryochloris sp. 'Moss Beach']|nr:hypothetical protein HRE53_06320 [Acaryochloris sp. 'Moss Beach']
MKKWRIIYHPQRRFSPMSWWVHKAVLEASPTTEWRNADQYEPAFPPCIFAKGFPYLVVTIDGFALEFASSHEVRHCIEILQQKHLPATKNLVCQNSTTYQGFNHWLAIYPASLKSWKQRQRTVKILTKTLVELESAGIRF